MKRFLCFILLLSGSVFGKDVVPRRDAQVRIYLSSKKCFVIFRIIAIYLFNSSTHHRNSLRYRIKLIEEILMFMVYYILYVNYIISHIKGLKTDK